jgi:hypothetical protein
LPGTVCDRPIPSPDKVFDTARIVCDGDGAHVLTPKVEAQPDGVHLVLDNRLSGNADYSIDHSDGGMGWNVPVGESERVANVPPGTARISCYRRSWGKEKVGEISEGTIKILAGDSGYKSTELDCSGKRATGDYGAYSEEAVNGRKGDPVELARRTFAGSLREGDVVEIAGNPESRDEKTVRVVRDGRVVATVTYFRSTSGWFGDVVDACAGF